MRDSRAVAPPTPCSTATADRTHRWAEAAPARQAVPLSFRPLACRTSRSREEDLRWAFGSSTAISAGSRARTCGPSTRWPGCSWPRSVGAPGSGWSTRRPTSTAFWTWRGSPSCSGSRPRYAGRRGGNPNSGNNRAVSRKKVTPAIRSPDSSTTCSDHGSQPPPGATRYWPKAGDPLARRGDQPRAAAGDAGPRHQRPDVGRPLQPQGVRRHETRGVLVQQRHQRGHVVALEGVDVAREQLLPAPRRSTLAGRPAARSLACERRPGALERAVDRRDARVRAARRPRWPASAGPRAGSAPPAGGAAGAGGRRRRPGGSSRGRRRPRPGRRPRVARGRRGSAGSR